MYIYIYPHSYITKQCVIWTEAAQELPTQPAEELEKYTETENLMQEEHIYVITFSRCPKEFGECLHEGDELAALRFLTESKGYTCRLPAGCSIFVHPEQHAQVRSQIAVGTIRLVNRWHLLRNLCQGLGETVTRHIYMHMYFSINAHTVLFYEGRCFARCFFFKHI